MADQVNFGKLDFYEIRNSIIEFLNNQSDVKDYNYEGSIVSTLIDILSYNTLYYAYYLNMASNEAFLDTAQRVDSIVSLVKPLGYVVPGRQSSQGKVKIRTGGAGLTIPRFSKFIGKNPSGVLYNFYTLEEKSLDNDGEGVFDVYEGKELIKNKPISITQNTQKGFIGNLDVFLKSLVVEVKKSGSGEWKEWSLSSNINQNLTEDSEVYFLERGEIGFYVVFGGRSSLVTSGQIGDEIGGDDAVRITYLVSSGSSANNIGSFVGSNITDISGEVQYVTLNLSSDGSDEPDLDNIKFFAPKWFSAQDRAVTANDAEAVLSEHGYSLGEFNVWGGEEMDPPFYGRVFVSHINDNNASDMVDILRSKTTVTVLPEYLSSSDIVYNLKGIVRYQPTLTTKTASNLLSTVLMKLNSKYSGKEMNRELNLTQIKQDIQSIEPSLTNAAFDFMVTTLSHGVPVSSTNNQIYFRQELEDNSLTSDFFMSIDSVHPIKIESYGNIDLKNEKKIRSYYHDNFGLKTIVNTTLGKINYFRGSVTFYGGKSQEYFSIHVKPYSETVTAKQNLTLDVSFSGLEIQP